MTIRLRQNQSANNRTRPAALKFTINAVVVPATSPATRTQLRRFRSTVSSSCGRTHPLFAITFLSSRWPECTHVGLQPVAWTSRRQRGVQAVSSRCSSWCCSSRWPSCRVAWANASSGRTKSPARSRRRGAAGRSSRDRISWCPTVRVVSKEGDKQIEQTAERRAVFTPDTLDIATDDERGGVNRYTVAPRDLGDVAAVSRYDRAVTARRQPCKRT
jgi:hypothetical protein